MDRKKNPNRIIPIPKHRLISVTKIYSAKKNGNKDFRLNKLPWKAGATAPFRTVDEAGIDAKHFSKRMIFSKDIGKK